VAAIEARPSEFYPISRYKNQLFKREVINELIRTGDVARALRTAQARVPEIRQLPTIRVRRASLGDLLSSPLVGKRPNLELGIGAEAGSDDRQISSIAVHNGTISSPPPVLSPPAKIRSASQEIQLAAGMNSICIDALDDRGARG